MTWGAIVRHGALLGTFYEESWGDPIGSGMRLKSDMVRLLCT